MHLMRSPLSGYLRSDGRWQISITLTMPGGGKRRQLFYARTQKAVQAKAHAFIAANPSRRAAPVKSVKDLLDHCEQEVWPKLHPRTQEQYKSCRKRLEKAFGRVRVDKLDVPMIYKWVIGLDAEGVGARTIQVHRNVLRGALQQALFLGWISTNPAMGWQLPLRIKPAPEPVITPAEVERAIALQSDPRLKTWLQTLWETGCRPDEATRLGAIHLRKDPRYGWWLDIPGTKTKAAKRSVPVTDELAQMLLDLGEPWFPYTRRQSIDHWHKTQRLLGWRTARTHGSRGTLDMPRPRLYAIRKARITLWGDRGLSDDVWAKIAGHESAELTRKVYDTVSLERIASQVGRKEQS